MIQSKGIGAPKHVKEEAYVDVSYRTVVVVHFARLQDHFISRR